MSTDSLHSLVTAAIWRAEQLEEHGVSSSPLAWAEVSSLAEELANAIPISQPEGRIARRGAVRAALKAHNYARAYALTQQYLAEEDAPKALRSALREILEEDARALASRYQYAAKHHGVEDARHLARWLQQGGAFGLAA
jgi:ParB-like chromosome segregation protein Spo0J